MKTTTLLIETSAKDVAAPSPPQAPDFANRFNGPSKRRGVASTLLQKSLTAFLIGAACQLAPQTVRAQDIDSMPPVVVKTMPEAGAKNVPPGEYEIKVKFSKDMTDHSWSWSTAWENSTPDGVGKPHYEADHRTCVFKVKLEPNKTYGFWLNSNHFHNFRDKDGRPAVPYLLVFQTKGN